MMKLIFGMCLIVNFYSGSMGGYNSNSLNLNTIDDVKSKFLESNACDEDYRQKIENPSSYKVNRYGILFEGDGALSPIIFILKKNKFEACTIIHFGIPADGYYKFQEGIWIRCSVTYWKSLLEEFNREDDT